jgi:hypothetical protein
MDARIKVKLTPERIPACDQSVEIKPVSDGQEKLGQNTN